VWLLYFARVRSEAFSVSTQFTVLTGKRREYPRGMRLVTRMAALQAELAGVGTKGILECGLLTQNAHHTRTRPAKASAVLVSGAVTLSALPEPSLTTSYLYQPVRAC
jgi:hypothetical protein